MKKRLSLILALSLIFSCSFAINANAQESNKAVLTVYETNTDDVCKIADPNICWGTYGDEQFKDELGGDLGEKYRECVDAIFSSAYNTEDKDMLIGISFALIYIGKYKEYDVCRFADIYLDEVITRRIGDIVFLNAACPSPYELGVFFIKDGNAFTLEEAYDSGNVDFSNEKLLKMMYLGGAYPIARVIDNCVNTETAEKIGSCLSEISFGTYQTAEIYGFANGCAIVGYENPDSRYEAVALGDYLVYDTTDLYCVDLKQYNAEKIDFSQPLSDFTIEDIAKIAPNVYHRYDPNLPSTPDETKPSTPDTTEPTKPATQDTTEPTEPPTPDTTEPTEPPTPDTTKPTEPTEPEKDLILGDTDGDGVIKINDVTLIQKAVALIETLSDKQQKAADVNGDSTLNIKDATAIQKYIAKIDTELDIGK